MTLSLRRSVYEAAVLGYPGLSTGGMVALRSVRLSLVLDYRAYDGAEEMIQEVKG